MPGKCYFCETRCVEREAAFGGTYTGACAECRREYDAEPRHVETCTRDKCVVCRDYRDEFGAV